uniref:Lymphoid-restricted membrane protein n=1 Tax=Gadus morhua TaxID=8049 RepID=A0A8C5BNF4_GADMO
MDPCPSSSPLSPRRHHNPVDSICRKLQSIQWCGDRQPHSPFQIPKLSSGGHQRTPHAALRSDLDPILKKRPAPEPPERGPPGSTPTNLTCSVSSTPGERRDWVGATGAPGGRQGATWQRYCSTPTTLTKDSVAAGLAFSSVQQPQTEDRAAAPPAHLLAYDPDLGRTADSAGGDGELAFPALVVRRLSLGESAFLARSETRKETMAEVSLICEEDLLDTIFHACDTQHRGRVYVSCIVDYLRHTTSRTSEDSGLEELCNMLDPERTDVSIDLDTYHAIMKEWINDCRSNGEDPTEDLNQDLMKCKDVLSAKRSMLLNMTSGSLEAFGGEASLVELETSELVYCVADLQMSNQRLQEEMKTLKQTAELLEEGNQRLVEENGELRAHARHSQQMAQREKMLKEELEEMKAALSSTEEGRARAQAHGKNLVRQRERERDINFKVTMEMEDLQGRLRKLCDINADLQVEASLPPPPLSPRPPLSLSLSLSVSDSVSCSQSIPALLRADKTQLETQMRMCHPDMTGRSVSLSVAYRLNQSTSGSLQTELALAQSPQEVSTGEAGATMLDETLDKEVLLLLQGPNPEHMALEFRALLSKLKAEFRAEAGSVLSAVRGVVDPQPTPGGSTEPGLQGELEARRADWVLGLDQLAQYADSLEKELIKMASNMRRSRTEILHLSVRVQEQENQKRQLGEELETLRTPQDSREAPCQVETPQDSREPPCQVETPPQDSSEALAVGEGERGEGGERVSEAGEERWTVVEDLGGGDEPRDASTPLPAPSEEPSPGLETLGESPPTPMLMDPCGGPVRLVEFQRLSLGFKCDLFTLEKRLRLEERSRDLAEENVRKEISSCQGLLQALIPLCDDDSQSIEIVHRLQKNLEILIQSMTRVSSRSEMLGAIHQEHRVGRAVEVMFQHVENLKRMYTKEHTELVELRQTLMQNERSFGSQTDKGTPGTPSDQHQTHRRTLTLGTKTQDLSESEAERLTRRSPWNVPGKSGLRPPLKRFISSGAWGDPDEPGLAPHAPGRPRLRPRLLALLACLVMQPAVDAAPVGTGDSWMTIQQLLWPYTGLRHNGQPPV